MSLVLRNLLKSETLLNNLTLLGSLEPTPTKPLMTLGTQMTWGLLGSRGNLLAEIMYLRKKLAFLLP